MIGPDGKQIPAFDMAGELGGPTTGRGSRAGSRNGTPNGGNRGGGYMGAGGGRGGGAGAQAGIRGYPGAAPAPERVAYFSPPYNDPYTGGYYEAFGDPVRRKDAQKRVSPF